MTKAKTDKTEGPQYTPTREEQVVSELETALADKSLLPQVRDVLRHFRFRDSIPNLDQRVMAMRCADLALVVALLPPSAEVVVALRELVRFRDQVLRATLPAVP